MEPIELPLYPSESRAGTAPEAGPGDRLAGRYAIVAGDGTRYLYAPEVQELFGVGPELAHVMGDALGRDAEDPVAVGARKLVAKLVDEHRERPLSDHRHTTPSLRDVVVHPSQVCNLNCVYCYAVEFNKVNKLMSPATADRVVAHTSELASTGLSSVKFLGGEPTLAWPIVERMMDGYLREAAARDVPPPRFVMVTNGTRLTPEIVAAAARYDMHVLVSIDGPAEIHDQLRPGKSGAPTHERATAGLEALVAGGVDVSIEGVYTRQHFLDGVTVQDMIDHYRSLGISEFAIAPTVGVWHESDTIEQIEAVRQLFVDAARASVRSFRGDEPYLLRGIQFVLDGFALRERRPHVCGAGRTFMAVNYDGEAFPCYLLESPATSYGVIGKSWRQDRYEVVYDAFARNGKQHHPVCRGCWANEICQSCLGTSWQISPEVTKPPAWFCGFQKALISAVLGEIGDARESASWPTFLANMREYLRPLAAA